MHERIVKSARAAVIPFASLVIGLVGALTIGLLLGESPLTILSILVRGSLGSPTQLGYSLFYATPLIFTGLCVAWAFRVGLFNIGAEGQMAIGGLAMAATGILLPGLPSAVAIPIAMIAAFVSAGAWGGLAGWIKAKRGCHEVLSTIMLNFIAYGLTSFLILNIFKNPDSQVPETAVVGEGYRLSQMTWVGGMSPLNVSLILGLVAASVYAFVFRRTGFGFHQRLAGGNPEVGRRAGINIDRHVILAMFISGGIAGLAGMSSILGYAYKAREGFTSGMGFVGIAVALLGRNSASGIILAALLFGALQKGALDLDLDTERVTRDLALVIQALIVLAVASGPGLQALFEKATGSMKRRGNTHG